jgi:hypothetical protein
MPVDPWQLVDGARLPTSCRVKALALGCCSSMQDVFDIHNQQVAKRLSPPASLSLYMSLGQLHAPIIGGRHRHIATDLLACRTENTPWAMAHGPCRARHGPWAHGPWAARNINCDLVCEVYNESPPPLLLSLDSITSTGTVPSCI